MSSRTLRGSTKRGTEDSNANSAQPQKRSKTANMVPKPQSRSKVSNAKTSDYMPTSKDDMEEGTDSTTKATRPIDSQSKSKSNTPNVNDKEEKPANLPSKSTLTSTLAPLTLTLTLTLPESTGDIFSAPPNTLLIHACNCEGSWGAGIAAAFRSHYPSASKIYSSHCSSHGHSLFGQALLIPPSEDLSKPQHFVGCLFTSRSKGKKKDSPQVILDATGPAMRDLMRQVREYEGAEKLGEVRMCKINSGLFNVKWERTKAVMEGIDVGEEDFKEVKVVSREE